MPQLHPRRCGRVPRNSGASPLTNQQGSALMAVIVISVLGAFVTMATMKGTTMTTKSAGNRRAKSSLLNLCEAGKEDALARIRAKTVAVTPSYKTQLIRSTSLGEGYYAVQCTANASGEWARLWSTGTIGNQSKTIEVDITIARRVFSLAWVKGAVTARCSVAVTGNAAIDGNDWDSLLYSTVGIGTYGVWSCEAVGTDGSAAVGGVGAVPPSRGIAPGAVYENGDCLDYPTTPEELLGLQPGDLDDFKMNAAEFGSMTFPFNDIVYVTESCGPVHCDNSTGILIVHNSTSDATLTINQGNFKGLIICDDLGKANGQFDIRGAVFVMGPWSGNRRNPKNANGSAEIKYSTRILQNLDEYAGARLIVSVISWREL